MLLDRYIWNNHTYFSTNHNCSRYEFAVWIFLDPIVLGYYVQAIQQLSFVLVNSFHLRHILYDWRNPILLKRFLQNVFTWMSNIELGLILTLYSLSNQWASFILFSCLTFWISKMKLWSFTSSFNFDNSSKWVIQLSPILYAINIILKISL